MEGAQTRTITSNSETFTYRTIYDIDVLVRDQDQTINYTKLFSSLNKTNEFRNLVRYDDQIWRFIKDYVETGDINSIIINENVFDFKANDVMEIPHNITTLEEIGVMNNLKTGYSNDVKGTYGCKDFLTLIAVLADVRIIRNINRIIILLNDMMESTNKNKDEIIEQLTKERDELAIKNKNVNSFVNHEKPGCIVFTKNKKGGDDSYDVTFSTKQLSNQSIGHENDIIAHNIYNVEYVHYLFKFYTRVGGLDFIQLVTGKHYLISDISKVLNFIEELREFKYDVNYDIDKIINDYVSTHVPGTSEFKGHMFEFYCSKFFDRKIYKYEKTEKLSLQKIDKGLDLLDVEKKIIGQCKWYDSSKLSQTKLQSFIDFCQDPYFKDWKKELYLNEDIKISSDVDLAMFDVIYVKYEQFGPFIDSFIIEEQVPKKKITVNPEPDISKINNFKVDDETYQSMREYIKKKLDENESILVSEMLKDLNTKYNCPSYLNAQIFYRMFSDLYIRTRRGSLPTDAMGHPLLKKFQNIDDERQWIEETIGYGEYIKDELIKQHNEYFKTDYTDQAYTRRFGDMFEKIHSQKGDRRGIFKKYIDGKQETIFRLEKPDAYDVFKSYIDEHSPTIEEFNKHFHRYETQTSFGMIMTEIRIPEITEFFKEHPGITDDNRKIFNRTFNKRTDTKTFTNLYNRLMTNE